MSVEEAGARAVNLVEIGDHRGLLQGGGVLDQQLAIAEDSSERRAELMAHGGEHQTLGLMSLLRDCLGMAQRFLGLLGRPGPEEDSGLGADAGEQLQICRRKTAWHGAGIHLDQAQQLVVGQEWRAHHAPDGEVHNGVMPLKTRIVEGITREDGALVQHHLLDNRAGDGHHVLRCCREVLRAGDDRDERVALGVRQQDEGTFGHRKHSKKTIEELLEERLPIRHRPERDAHLTQGLQAFESLAQPLGRVVLCGHSPRACSPRRRASG